MDYLIGKRYVEDKIIDKIIAETFSIIKKELPKEVQIYQVVRFVLEEALTNLDQLKVEL